MTLINEIMNPFEVKTRFFAESDENLSEELLDDEQELDENEEEMMDEEEEEMMDEDEEEMMDEEEDAEEENEEDDE